MGAPLDRAFGEILGQGRRPVRRQGRLDAPDRHERRRARLVRDRRRPPADRRRARRSPRSYQRTGRVSALCFFGDGATNIGAFHEALNLASVWKLPVVFVCENNLYGEYSPIATTTPIERLVDRAASYAMAADADRRQRRLAVRARGRREAARARAARRRADADRGADLPAEGPLAQPTRRRTGRRASSSAGWQRDPITLLRAAARRARASTRERLRADRARPPRQAVADALERAHELARAGTSTSRLTRRVRMSETSPTARRSPGRWPTRSRPTRACSCSARTSAPPGASSRSPTACSSGSAPQRVLRHADLRAGDRRHGDRRRADGAAARGRDHVRRLRRRLLRPDRQRAGQVPLHDRRPGDSVPVTIRMANGAGGGLRRPALAVASRTGS